MMLIQHVNADSSVGSTASEKGHRVRVVYESTEYPSQVYPSHIYKVYNIDLLLFNPGPPLIALMPTSSTHPSSSSQPPPSSRTDSDGHHDEEVGAAVWKRRYIALQESVNTEKSSKRKSQ